MDVSSTEDGSFVAARLTFEFGDGEAALFAEQLGDCDW